MRILAKAGYFEESWADNLSMPDQMPGPDFAYAPFDPALDFPDIGQFIEFLQNPSPVRDWILSGMNQDADRSHGRNQYDNLAVMDAQSQ